MNCPQCQHENPSSAKFCQECGTKLQAVCSHCGFELPPNAKYCQECGAALAATSAAPTPPPPASPPSLEAEFASLQQALPTSLRDYLLTPTEGENRLVTVLFADMSRSLETTRSMHPEEAAELVNRLLKAMVDVLLKMEGRIDKLLGDGVLAVFGVPQAHEDDPERAIRAALAIREAARELGLEVSAGINTGEVYVGGMGTERHQEVTVMGPVVHLAARFQEQAEPGQILVGEATYRLARRAFEFAPLSLTIKGLTQPVSAYAAERALPRPEKVRGIEGLRAELIGREQELAQLNEALAEVLRGRGQIVSLIGEAGVGKSRLVSELKQVALAPAEERPAPLWLDGRCLELGMSASYWLFVDLFRQYFAFPPDADERARAERLVTSLRELVERGALSEERLEEIGPLFGNLLSIRFGTEWDERLQNTSPEQIKHQTFIAIRDFLIALGKQQPVILVCEDLHWADTLSLDLIALLIESLTLAPLFLLCVYRPEREHKCWHLGTLASRKCPERYTELHLRELTPAQSRRLVEALLTIEELPASAKELILEKSRGNPFFAEEVIRSLIASGMVYQEGGTWRAKAGIESITVPESVQAVILSRVDRLERELRRVLESAAVIGRLFRRRLLEYTTREVRELERALWELEDHQLIYQERVLPEEEYSFQHVLTQETIYQSLLRRRRAAFHQQVAEAIETLYAEGLEEYYEQLAYHYERSNADEKAIEYLLRAGQKAERAYMNEEAVGYLTRALDRIDRCREAENRPTWRLQALKVLGQIHHRRGEEAQAEAEFREAVGLGQEMGLPPRDRVRLYWWLADVLFWQYRFAEVIAVGEEGLALLGAENQSVDAALMNETLASGYARMGDEQRSREFVRRNKRFIGDLPYSEELRSAFTQVVSLASSEGEEERANWLRTFEQRAERHHDLKALGQIYQYLADDADARGDIRGAISRLEQAGALFAKTGDAKHESSLLFVLGRSYLAVGDLERADACANGGLRAAEDRVRQALAISYRTTVPLLLSQGFWERAAETCRNTIQLHRELDLTGMWPTLMLGRTYLAWGQRLEAREQLQKAMELVQTDSPLLPLVLVENLSSLEEAYDDPAEFQAICRRFLEEHPEASGRSLVQWFLEPTEPRTVFRCREHTEFAVPLPPAWEWHDPFADCAWTVSTGLEIRAANARELWHRNLSAPRLLQTVSGDFAVQTVCACAFADRPAIGGLSLWKSSGDFLRLDWGARGKPEVSFDGWLSNSGTRIGRGRLPCERVVLRLERLGSRVRALCSADGEKWFTVGQVEFPVEDPVQVGLHAIGNIDRTIYPGAYPEGTAIRFESFQLWR